MELARITGGISQSICSPSFANVMTQIGQDVTTTVTDKVTIVHTPVAGTVKVKFVPARGISFTVNGRDVLFSAPIPVGTAIDVSYDYL